MIYLDHAATTRPNARALERAGVFYQTTWFNPSALYAGGTEAARAVRAARESLLSRIADPFVHELVFTSGGTEADNQAIFCGAKRGNAVATLGEHSAVFSALKELKGRGVEPRFAPLCADGSVNGEELLRLVDEKTSFVSVVHVNSETGAVNDICALSKAVKQKNPRTLFHSDGVQAFGKIPVRLPKEIDLYSVSAHKIGGVKGVGALYKAKSLRSFTYQFGGGQESDFRSGTENVFGICCFSYAAEEVFSELPVNAERVAALRELLFSRLDQEIFTRLSSERGTPYILTVSAKGLRGAVLQQLLSAQGVFAGTGSACSSKKPFSRVLEACGYPQETLYGVLRFSFSPQTTEEEVLAGAEIINRAARELKSRL